MAAQQPILERHVQDLLDTFLIKHVPSFETLPIELIRIFLSEEQQRTTTTPITLTPKKLVLPIGPHGNVLVHIFYPSHARTNPLPTIMYFHGGGWLWGDEKTHERLVQDLVYGTHAAVVFVSYRLAPEAPFPTAHEECYAATQWIAEHGASLHLDSSRLAVVGDSAGGLLATAVALMAQERNGPTITAQVLLCPITDEPGLTESYKQFANGYYLEKEAVEWAWNLYVPDASLRNKPLMSPLKASLEQLKQLPQTLIITSECDVLRDEGEAYAHKLIQAGVEVTAMRYLGMIHDFMLINALETIPAVKSACAQITDFLNKAFTT